MKTTIKLSILAIVTSQYCASLSAETFPLKAEAMPDSAIEASDFERISITANRKESLDTDLAMSVHRVGKEELGIDNGQHVAESLK